MKVRWIPAFMGIDMSQWLTREHENITLPLSPPLKGGEIIKCTSPLRGEDEGEGYFRVNDLEAYSYFFGHDDSMWAACIRQRLLGVDIKIY